MRLLLAGALLLCAAPRLLPQDQPAMLDNNAALQLGKTIVQSMETVSVVIPALDRSGAGVLESARQRIKQLQLTPASSAAVYPLLNDARAFLAVADLTPKPNPFPGSSAKQLTTLRESVLRLESHFAALLEHDQTMLRSSDRDNLHRYAEENERVGPAQPSVPRVVFMGDSITDFWHLNEYFTGRDFLNRGISGQVTSEMLGRMKADVLDLRPGAMLLLAGTNDIGRGTPLRTIENNITMMVELAKAHQVRVLIASVLPVNDYKKSVNPQFERTRQRPPNQINDLNRWIQNYCVQNQLTYVNYHDAMADGGGMLRDDLTDDGLHPNAKGYRIMAPIAAAALNTNLSVAPVDPGKRRRKLF